MSPGALNDQTTVKYTHVVQQSSHIDGIRVGLELIDNHGWFHGSTLRILFLDKDQGRTHGIACAVVKLAKRHELGMTIF